MNSKIPLSFIHNKTNQYSCYFKKKKRYAQTFKIYDVWCKKKCQHATKCIAEQSSAQLWFQKCIFPKTYSNTLIKNRFIGVGVHVLRMVQWLKSHHKFNFCLRNAEQILKNRRGLEKKSGKSLCSFCSDIGESAVAVDKSSSESSSMAAGNPRIGVSVAGRANAFNDENVGRDETKASFVPVTEYPEIHVF